MGELAKKALKALQEQGGRNIDTDLIKKTIQEIDKEYKPGLLAWIRTEYRHSRWEEMFRLEDAVNKAALAGDETGLRAALAAYKTFFKEMADAYSKGETLRLFGTDKKEEAESVASD